VVSAQKPFVDGRADERERTRAAHDAVELVAVQHQEPPAVGPRVHGPIGDPDIAEHHAVVAAQELVVVSGHEHDLRAMLVRDTTGACSRCRIG